MQQDVRINPHEAWIKEEIPDVSDPGGELQYIVKADIPFNVYFFTDRERLSSRQIIVDVLAATRAGADSAFIRRPHRDDYQLAANPTYEVESLDDVVAIC